MAEADSPEGEAIAIIAMAARLPGARNTDEFWSNLRDGVESIRSFTPEELAAAGVDEQTLSDPHFVNSGALADDLDCFDAAFFGISRREAEIMDPQHRVFLEVAWEALERAGYEPEGYDGLIGIFGGIAPNTYRQKVLDTRPELLAKVGDYLAMISSEKEYAITRVAFKLNLRGPSLSVNTACSSSGVALHLACQSLLSGENDLCLVGGGRIRVPLTAGYVYQEDGIPSPDGHCRAFDADARGTAIGNGVSMVVLKRLSEALEDRDTIHAVVKGTAVNNDGSAKVGFTAPGVQGQSAVIAEALEVAGVSADSIQYLEAHGTGTALGDPIEIAGATRAFRESTDRTGYCGVGSLKTNIGHLDAGAGITGVIKTALALEQRQIPASLNFERPNPQIDFANSPFYVNDALREWPRESEPRRAGVSSFGLGGTNVHIVLEEAPEPEPSSGSRAQQLLVWSARTEEALDAVGKRLRAHLETHPEQDLADVAHTLQRGRRGFACRRSLVCADRQDAIAALTANDGRITTRTGVDGEARVAFLFPGGGAAYVGMGRDLVESEPVFRDAVDRCAGILGDSLGRDLRDILYSEESVEADLDRPGVSFPLLFTIEYALSQLWLSWGVEPQAMIGHSMGEYTAACLAGVLSFEDALRVVALRGKLFDELEPGGMLAAGLSEEAARERAGSELDVAAVNRPDSCVLTGPEASVDRVQGELEADGVQCTRVHIKVGLHSRMLDGVLEKFRRFLADIHFAAPTLPFLSNVTGTWITPEQATDPDYWVRHMRETVRFADGLATLFADGEAVLLEVGPGQTLSSFARQHPDRPRGQVAIASLRHPRESTADDVFLLTSLGRLWQAGVAIDWSGFGAEERRRRVPLPSYPFERKRYWVEASTTRPVDLPGLSPVEMPVAIAPPTASPAPVAEQRSRAERIRDELTGVIEDLSGLAADEIDAHATFLELGLDSLLLTQANAEIQRRFGIRITFRELFEEARTLDLLAAYLDRALPDDAFAPAAPSEPAPGVTPPAAAPGSLEQVIAEQMQIMQDQLALLGIDPTRAGTAHGALRQQVKGALAGEATAPSRPEPVPGAAVSHGPWRPAVASPTQQLTDRQRQHLEALIARFNEKTRGSKQHVQAHRASLSDPRTGAGFQPAWKELVYPIIAERAQGARLWDIDGNEWLDITQGFGVSLFGHSPDFIQAALREQLDRSTAIGPGSPLAGEVAELVCEFTGLERAAFCNTGSEAVLAAIRMARTVTGRDRIAVFDGSYHGIFDEVLTRRVTVRGEERCLPVAPGIPRSAVGNVSVLDYGSEAALDAIREQAGELAAVLVEPIQSRNPALQPVEFVRALRELTEELGIALVFDELITGFRLHPGGAQAVYGVKADIATYGKVVGGGMPIGIVAGSARYLDALDGGYWSFGDDSVPEAGVTWFAGTFVRHPLALAAARAALLHMKAAGPSLQAELNATTAGLVSELNDWFAANDFPVSIASFASLMHFRISEECEFGPLYFQYLRDRGIHCTERRPHFLTTAHGEPELAELRDALRGAALDMREAGFFAEAGATLPRQLPAPALRSLDTATRSEFPLTEAQLEIWLASVMGDDASRAFQISCRIDLEGDLDREALDRAICALVQRHDALRIRIVEGGERQRVAPRIDVPIRHVDLRRVVAASVEARLEQLLEADSEELFDLQAGPLVRFMVISLPGDRHRVMISAHHIICDGWSLGILGRDLGGLYEGELGGTGLDSTPAQFGDFAIEQGRRQTGKSGAEAEEYWLRRFQGPIPVLELPTDRTRPAIKTYVGGQEGIRLGQGQLEQLKRVATDHRATVFSLVLAAYSVMLKRISNNEDVVVGVATAGQTAMGTADLVGHCVSLYPFRSKTPLAESFKSQLAEMQNSLIDSLDYGDLTFGSLIRRLDLPRDPGRLPLLSTLVTHETDTEGLSFAGLEVEMAANPKRFCNFDIELYLTETQSDLTLEFHYNRDLFEAATVRRLLGNFARLLQGICEAPDRPGASLPLLTDGERRQILVEWNPRAATTPRERGVQDLFSVQAAHTPNAEALVCGEQRLSYAELDRRSNQLAHHLLGLGVGRDVLVALCLERSVDLIVAMLGVHKAGGAYVPVDPKYPSERVAFMLEDAEAAVLVTQDSLVEQLPAAGVKTLLMDGDRERIHAESDQPLPRTAVPDALSHVIYTSGSTGKPKGVAIEHRSVVALVEWAQTVFSEAELRGVLASTSVCFDLSVFEIFLPLCSGGKVVLVENALALAERLDDPEITLINSVPSVISELLEATGALPPNVVTVNLAGEPLTVGLVQRLYALDSVERVYDLYGPSEDTTYSTFSLRRADGPAIIGRPIDDTQAFVLDEFRQPVPIGVHGELYLGGAGLARGYLNRPELTADRFVRSPFSDDPSERLYRTGDLVKYLPDGNLQYLGRIDSQVKIRGFRIELGEISAALEEHPGIDQATVIATGEGVKRRLVGYFAGAEPLASQDLQLYLGRFLPDYMVPRVFVQLERLPQTPSGKIDKRALPPVAAAVAAEASPLLAAQDDVELQLAALWRRMLEVEQVGREDDFFQLGGHSLAAVRVIGWIDQQLGVKIPLTTFFEDPTVAALARAVRSSGGAARLETVIELRAGAPSARALFCIGGVHLYQPLANAVSADLPVYGVFSHIEMEWLAALQRGEQPQLPSAEAIATECVAAIREVQPQGPYRLGGLSYGGVLAYEMARQLRAEGQEVEALFLFDVRLALGHARGPIRAVVHWLRRIGERWARRVALRQSDQNLESIRDSLFLDALDDYESRIAPYDGSALVCRAMDEQMTAPVKADPYMGWSGLVRGELKVVDCPGDHLGVISETHVSVAAGAVDAYLAESGPTGPGARLRVSRGVRGR